MATTFVPCESWEQAMSLRDAGLLYVDRSSCNPRSEQFAKRELCPAGISHYLNGFSSMDDLEARSGWKRTDLCYLVED